MNKDVWVSPKCLEKRDVPKFKGTTQVKPERNGDAVSKESRTASTLEKDYTVSSS